MSSPQPALFPVVEIAAAEAHRYPDVLTDLWRKTYRAVILRGAFPPAAMEHLVTRLERRDPPLTEVPYPEKFNSHFYGGCCLDLSPPDLVEYFQGARKFQEDCAALFAEGPHLLTEMRRFIQRVGGGRAVETPRSPAGDSYLEATFRAHRPGGYLPPHCDNEQTLRPPYTQLNRVIDPALILSYVLTLAPPQCGGELLLYDLQWEALDASMFHEKRTHLEPIIHRYPSLPLTARAGDLIIFDAGRIVHAIHRISGNQTRWNLGAFMAFSRDHRTVHLWS